MILNPGKCYYLSFDSNTTKNEFVLEEATILSSAKEYVVLGLLLKPGPGPWTQTLKKLDPERPEP